MILIIHTHHHLLRKKRYEIMKDPVFLSLPIYPHFISTNTSLSTNRDDHLISLLSHDDFTFKAQLTSLYMHPTNYSFRLFDKNQDFFTSIASKIMGPYQYWLDNGAVFFVPWDGMCFWMYATLAANLFTSAGSARAAISGRFGRGTVGADLGRLLSVPLAASAPSCAATASRPHCCSMSWRPTMSSEDKVKPGSPCLRVSWRGVGPVGFGHEGLVLFFAFGLAGGAFGNTGV